MGWVFLPSAEGAAGVKLPRPRGGASWALPQSAGAFAFAGVLQLSRGARSVVTLRKQAPVRPLGSGETCHPPRCPESGPGVLSPPCRPVFSHAKALEENKPGNPGNLRCWVNSFSAGP